MCRTRTFQLGLRTVQLVFSAGIVLVCEVLIYVGVFAVRVGVTVIVVLKVEVKLKVIISQCRRLFIVFEDIESALVIYLCLLMLINLLFMRVIGSMCLYI